MGKRKSSKVSRNVVYEVDALPTLTRSARFAYLPLIETCGQKRSVELRLWTGHGVLKVLCLLSSTGPGKIGQSKRLPNLLEHIERLLK